MTEPEKLLPHESDGIQEYDNPSPGWWLWTFYGAVAFAVGYMFFYGMNFGGGYHASWSKDMIRETAAVQSWYARNPMTPPTTERLLSAAADPAVLAVGREAFARSCASCHGDQAQGLIGPNLTDPYWLHGGKATDVKGVPSKGMPTWGRKFKAEDLTALAAFVLGVQGSLPPDPKAPEGKLVDMEPLVGGSLAEAPSPTPPL
jgi:cytochrome c oxidase cbb3-type subunit 3